MGKDAPLGASLGHRNDQMRFGAEAFGQGEDTTRGEKEAGIGLEQRAASPMAGWWAGLAVAGSAPAAPHPAPHLCSPTGVFRQPSITRPRVTCVPGPWGGSCLPQGRHLCRGGLYRCWETPGRSGSVLLAPKLLLDVHGALLAPGRAGSPLPWGCVRAETGPSPGGHWGQGGRSASSPASPAGQAAGGSVKTP